MPFNPNQGSFVRLRDHYAERRRPIVFWVGAGLSTDAGLPTWPALRKSIISQSLETVSTYEPKAAREAEAKLDIALNEPNLWTAFQMIKDVMGETEFRESIRHVFRNTSKSDVPDTYLLLWTMKNIDGILSFNIDNFASRAHRRIRSEEEIVEFYGRQSKDYMSAISNGKKFIANLHGQKDAYSSWIFTKKEIDNLVNDESYNDFINYIFTSMTVIFLGISADDIAAGSFLEKLTAKGLDVGPHFWITDRVDSRTTQWSGRAGVQIVRYTPGLDLKGKLSHAVALADISKNIHNYVSRDQRAAAVLPKIASAETIPSVKDLRAKDDDEIREILARYAKGLLARSDDQAKSDYRTFLKTYASSIHQAWHVNQHDPETTFFGYQVVERIANSTFSNVWRLVDEQSNNYALKIIQIDNLHAGAQIDSFRRGVQSLKYLTNADVPGTASILDAYEIPTSMIMRFIEGQNLQEVAATRDFDFWREGLSIIINVCKHLEYSHNLPQAVLHRDVRPSNIMVPNYFWSEVEAVDQSIDRFSAVLLNYDMSWHVNAKGQTVAGNLQESGYYAPELLEQSREEVARRTSVDAYGLGMCIYHIYTRMTPPAGGSKSTDWDHALSQKFKPVHRMMWRSAPERLRRIIRDATIPNDEERASIRSVRLRLEALFHAISGSYDKIALDLWAEELLSRTLQTDYETSKGENEFSKNMKAGRSVRCRADFSRKRLEINFSNIATESTDRARAARSWGDKLKAAQEILKSGGFEIGKQTSGRGLNILLSATIEIDILRSDFEAVIRNLNKGIDQVRLD